MVGYYVLLETELYHDPSIVTTRFGSRRVSGSLP